MTRKTLFICAIAAALALPVVSERAAGDSSAGASANETHVSIDGYAFKAPKVTVKPGATVVWKNMDDDPHTVTADDGSFDSKGLGQGDTYSHVFTKPGTYPYHCSAHPYMKGVVVVEGS